MASNFLEEGSYLEGLSDEEISNLTGEEHRILFAKKMDSLPDVEPAYIFITPPYQPLRVSTGWTIERNSFYELNPDAELKFKAIEHDDGWLLFEQELFIFRYPKKGLILDMGWFPSGNEGKFILQLVKAEGWEILKTVCKTRSLTGITEAVNDAMLNISRESRDDAIETRGLKLQELRPYNGWTFVKNEFFDLEPESDMKVEGLPNNDGWQLMKPEMLLLEAGHFQIKVGWFPAYGPVGHFQITAVSKDYFNPPLVDFSSRDKAEVVEIIEHLMKNIDKLKPNRR